MNNNIFIFFRQMLYFLVGFLIFFSCKGPRQDEDVQTDTISRQADDIYKDKNTFYKLPSPVEFYSILWEEKANFNRDALNPTDNVSKYLTTQSKAINFGIYSSDFVYCSVFERNQETLLYFTTAKKLADDLGLTAGFDKSVVERININLGRSDSLYQITSDSYWHAYNYLEENNKVNILPFMIVGGWIESLYVGIISIDKFSPTNPIIVRIAEQQLLLENLVEYLENFKDDTQLKEILNKLFSLKSSYDKLYENIDEIITKSQFDEISAKVKAIRKELIS